jgi:hypothetical protein
MRLVRRAVVTVVAAGVLTGLAGSAQAQFVVYDKFAGGVIDPEKWQGISLEGGFSAPTAEFIRAVESGTLHLKLVSYGDDTTDSGSETSRLGLGIRELGTLGGSGSITGMNAKVTVHNAVVQDCVANPLTGGAIRARAQLIGWFFNDGSTGSSDETGNIIAGLQLQKEANGSNQIAPFVQRCENSTCSSVSNPALTGNGVAFSAHWSLDSPLVLKLVWDQADGKFTFSIRDPVALTSESHAVVYQGTITDAGPPVPGDFRHVRVQNSVKNCSTGRKQVLMDAFFDNIKVQRAP